MVNEVLICLTMRADGFSIVLHVVLSYNLATIYEMFSSSPFSIPRHFPPRPFSPNIPFLLLSPLKLQHLVCFLPLYVILFPLPLLLLLLFVHSSYTSTLRSPPSSRPSPTTLPTTSTLAFLIRLPSRHFRHLPAFSPNNPLSSVFSSYTYMAPPLPLPTSSASRLRSSIPHHFRHLPPPPPFSPTNSPFLCFLLLYFCTSLASFFYTSSSSSYYFCTASSSFFSCSFSFTAPYSSSFKS